MDVVVWNMQHIEGNWDLLRAGGPLAADVHVLCEAPRPPRKVPAIGQWRTIGLEADLPLDKPVKREWSTSIASSDVGWITDARVDRLYGEPLPFKPSRPGSWTAGRVRVGKLAFTVVALYGLLDERSDASVHRSLSELAPLFDHKVYGKSVLLGGDLNVFANPRPNDPALARHAGVLERIRSYGLESCLEVAPAPARKTQKDCPCDKRSCRHQRTYRRSPSNPGRPYEEDYLFASKAMIRRLRSCEVLPFVETSDHAPIRATFTV